MARLGFLVVCHTTQYITPLSYSILVLHLFILILLSFLGRLTQGLASLELEKGVICWVVRDTTIKPVADTFVVMCNLSI